MQLKVVAAEHGKGYYISDEGKILHLGKKEILISRLKLWPKDFTFEEAETLLDYCSYKRSNKGGTSGSRVMFTIDNHTPILPHKPHPRKELLGYQIKQLIEILEQEGPLGITQ